MEVQSRPRFQPKNRSCQPEGITLSSMSGATLTMAMMPMAMEATVRMQNWTTSVNTTLHRSEEQVVPAGGNHLVQHVRGDLDHGNDADGDGSDGQDAELDDFGEHHAEHPAFD